MCTAEALAATPAEAPKPAARLAMAASDAAETVTEPPVEVAVESTISAVTVLWMALSATAAPRAATPLTEMLPAKDTILALGLTSFPLRAEVKVVTMLAGAAMAELKSGTTRGAVSEAESEILPPAVTVESSTLAVTVLPRSFRVREALAAPSPAPATPMA